MREKQVVLFFLYRHVVKAEKNGDLDINQLR